MRPRLPLAESLATPPPAPASAHALSSGGEASLLQVGDLAKASGKTVRALHLYEEMGLLKPAGRSKGRYRLYDADALVQIRWISKLQELGLSLHEIRAVAQGNQADAMARKVADKMRAVYREKLADTREQLRKLHELEHELGVALAYLDECTSVCEPRRALQACRSCELHSDPHHEGGGCAGHAERLIPDLVRGFQLVSDPAASRSPEPTDDEIR